MALGSPRRKADRRVIGCEENRHKRQEHNALASVLLAQPTGKNDVAVWVGGDTQFCRH